MDLLVSCPDKPSNGTYFFENDSQDPTITMPVFKPGVQVGNGYHYRLLSERNGQQIVMKPGKEYRRDSETGKFDLDSPVNIEAATNPNTTANGRIRANMWRTVDYDGHRDHDLIAGIGDWTELGWDHAYDSQGRWRNGPLHGYIYFTENVGSDDSPEYSKTAVRLAAGGGDIDVYGWPSPNFADFDGDGDLDLLCGEFMDGFTYFQNTGTKTNPVYSAGVRLKNGTGQQLAMHLQMITPTAIDWDGDGRLDVLVNSENATWYRNCEDRNGKVVLKKIGNLARRNVAGHTSSPAVADLNNDAKPDLIVGSENGRIYHINHHDCVKFDAHQLRSRADIR